MSSVLDSIKEEIRQLRINGGEVCDIFNQMKKKGIEMSYSQCSAIAAWASPKLAVKRKVQLPHNADSKLGKEDKFLPILKTRVKNKNPDELPKRMEEKISTNDQTWANNEGPLLTKGEAVGLLSQGYNPKKMAGYYKGHSEGELRALSAHIEMGTYVRNPALLEGNGKGKNGEVKVIREKEDLVPFLKKNQLARDMSLLALTLGEDGGQIEEALIALYGGKFKNRDELHRLLEETREDVAQIIQEGVTNLGVYLGGYSLFDRRMTPIILGDVVSAIPLDKITPPLEAMLLGVAGGIYDPLFSANPKKTIEDLKTKSRSSEGLTTKICEVLYRKYENALNIGERLKRYDRLREKVE